MDTITPPTEPHGPVVSLTCCCCGSGTTGRQWWNRDTGFGLCSRCHQVCGVAHLPSGAEARSYGIRGVHWDIPSTTATA